MRYLSLALLAACSSAPTLPAPLLGAADGIRMGDLESPGPRGVLSALGVLAPSTGLVRMLHGNTACQSEGGVNPYVSLPRNIPTAGEQFTILFVTRHGHPAPPDAPAWLVMSHEPFDKPIPFGPYGMPGCQLLVRADNVQFLLPGSWHKDLIYREGGQIRFTWTPPAWVAGTSLFLQLLVSAPGQNKAGMLASPAVEIVVGSPR